MGQRKNWAVLIIFCAAALFSGCATHNAAMDFHTDPLEPRPPGSEYLKSIVVYDSWSGSTGKIAGEIARVLNCPSVHVDRAADYFPCCYDLVVVGSPVHGGVPTDKIEAFLAGLEDVSASAVFVTYGAPFFGSWTADRCLSSMEEQLSGTSVGRFKCNGHHKILRTYPRHPDDTDLIEAARFAEGLLQRVAIGETPQPGQSQ